MKNLDTIITADITRVTTAFAKRADITRDEAMRAFFSSASYRALCKPETGLCYEMTEAIYEMFLEEMGYDI
jgi:hypothetical protein